MTSPIVSTLLATIGSDWTDGTLELDLSTISLLVSQLIPAIEKLVSGKGRGPYKKEILIQTVHAILTQLGKKDLADTIDPILPQLVDSMVGLLNTHKNCCNII